MKLNRLKKSSVKSRDTTCKPTKIREIAMTYLAQILGTSLLGVVSSYTPAQLGHMNRTLRAQQSRKGRK